MDQDGQNLAQGYCPPRHIKKVSRGKSVHGEGALGPDRTHRRSWLCLLHALKPLASQSTSLNLYLPFYEVRIAIPTSQALLIVERPNEKPLAQVSAECFHSPIPFSSPKRTLEELLKQTPKLWQTT